jgi:hypothetical protein
MQNNYRKRKIILFPLLCSVCLFGCSNMINVAGLDSDIPQGDSGKPKLVIAQDSLQWQFDNKNTPSDTTDDTYTAEWGAATGGTVQSYTVSLYYWDNQIDSETVSPTDPTSFGFTSAMKTNGVFNDGSYYFTVQALSTDPSTIANSDVMRSPDQAIGGMYVNNNGFSSSSFPAAGDLTITRSDGASTSGKGTAANPHKLSFTDGQSLTITVTGLSGTVGAVSWTVNGTSTGTSSTTYTFRAEDWNQGTYTIAVHATISGVAYSAMTVAEVDL